MKTCAYIVQANADTPALLCVRDYEREQYHQFEIDLPVLARLAAECTARVNAKISGFDMEAAERDIAAELSRMWQDRGLPSG